MPDVILPLGVRYTCLRCGQCCRSLEVTLTDEERARLLAAEGLGATAEMFGRIRGARGRQRWRLRPRPGGACPFLDGDNLCRVHAALGHAAKPFAGRVFPFQFAATPAGVFVGCRFSCPAVVRGHGAELEAQRGEIQRLHKEHARTYEPPREDEPARFFGHYKLPWRDLLRIEDQLLAFLLVNDLALPRRLLAGVRLVRRFVRTMVGRRADARVGVDPQAILDGVRGKLGPARLSAVERLLLRLGLAALVGGTPHWFRELSLGRRVAVRLRNVWRRLKMALGVGRLPLPGDGRLIRLRQVPPPSAATLEPESAAMLERYLVAKLSSQQFFGRACFSRSFAVGFEWLAGALAAIMWLAAARAAAEGRSEPGPADIEYGIQQVDQGYNYLRELGGLSARLRAALLWHWGTIEKLLSRLCSKASEPEGMET